jgi:hypothetical protein
MADHNSEDRQLKIFFIKIKKRIVMKLFRKLTVALCALLMLIAFACNNGSKRSTTGRIYNDTQAMPAPSNLPAETKAGEKDEGKKRIP